MKYGSLSRWVLISLCLFLSVQLSAQGAPSLATAAQVFDPGSQPAIPVTLQRVLTGLTLPTSIAHAGDVDGAADRVLRFGPPRNSWQPLAGEW